MQIAMQVGWRVKPGGYWNDDGIGINYEEVIIEEMCDGFILCFMADGFMFHIIFFPLIFCFSILLILLNYYYYTIIILN